MQSHSADANYPIFPPQRPSQSLRNHDLHPWGSPQGAPAPFGSQPHIYSLPVARLELLLPLIFALSFDPAYARQTHGLGPPAIFLGTLLLLVLAARLLASRLTNRIADESLHEAASRIGRLLGYARTAALLWTAAGLYLFGWSAIVPNILGSLHLKSADLASALLLTLPSYLTWIALYWAQYPADRATREQAIVQQIDANLPVHAPPTLAQFLEHQLRTGPGLLLMPVLVVLLVRDLVFLSLRLAHIQPAEWIQAVTYLGSTLVVYILSPLILVRVLRTQPLPAGRLRTRLDAIAKRSGINVRQLFIWHTGNAAGNALVSGVVPRFRYVLLSDLLVETMPDEQIEAVFAHELGHIVHRHMIWYGIYLLSLSIVLGWLTYLQLWIEAHFKIPLGGEATSSLVSLAFVLLGFGLLSRRFERQADVYAARAMQHPAPLPPPDPAMVSVSPSPEEKSQSDRDAVAVAIASIPTATLEPTDAPAPLSIPVGPRGASTFCAALERVAYINNIPVAAKNFTHGSIKSRLDALTSLALTPASTPLFDRQMRRIRYLLLAITATAAITIVFIGVH